MANRREFLQSVAVLGVAGALGTASAQNIAGGGAVDDRDYWVVSLERICTPVLKNLSQRQLKETMPVEATRPADRARYTHLEAFGRTLAGIAPWLAATGLGDAESATQKNLLGLVQESLDAATDPKSPDFLNFKDGDQPLVDAAFLAQGILRAQDVLWKPLPARVQQQVIAALKSSRAIATPTRNNWVLFAAMIETALLVMGQPTMPDRLDDCMKKMLGWYVGDGIYGDGDFFHFDYYNSFVIHPMLIDILATLQSRDARFKPAYAAELIRARRYAEIQERLIGPDGTLPAVGRSICYRFGALQALAQMSLIKQLPEHVAPAQVRSAMTAVIRKMIEPAGTFDDAGWLRIGLYGHQPALAEDYISTGSLYMCTAVFLPLGLSPTDEFWSAPAKPWTSQQLAAGQSLPADHALRDARQIDFPNVQS